MGSKVKEIQFTFLEESKEVRQFVYAELENISPYLTRIIRSLYDLNWEGDLDEGRNQVNFTIPFNRGMPTGGPLARVFEFEFYTDNSDFFLLYVNEWGEGRADNIARVKLKFSDWMPPPV